MISFFVCPFAMVTNDIHRGRPLAPITLLLSVWSLYVGNYSTSLQSLLQSTTLICFVCVASCNLTMQEICQYGRISLTELQNKILV